MRRATVYLLTFSISAYAADFWIAKPYADWSEKEVAKMLTNSPWAHQAWLNTPESPRSGDTGPTPSAPRPSSNSPGNTAAMDAVGALPDGARRPGDSASSDSGLSSPGVRVAVRWQSALPIRQALLRRESPAAISNLNAEEPHYLLAICGLPMAPPSGEVLGAMKLKFRASASLNRKGKTPITPEQVEVARSGKTTEIFLLFPKTDAIAADDGEVEFRSLTPFGPVHAKFRLKDMVLRGRLLL